MPAKAVHKQALVETAMRLFRRQGYANTGLNQILHDSAAPRGSLYHYFPGGKEALAEDAVHLAGNMVREMLEGLSAQKRSVRSFVKGYCETMAGWMEESGFRSGCPIATTMLETAPDSPALTAAGKAALEGWMEVIAGVFARAGHKPADAQRQARSLIGAVQGALILARIWRDAEPIRDVARHYA